VSAVGSILAKIAVFLVTASIGFVAATVVVSATSDHGPKSAASEAPQYLLQGPDTPAGPGVPVAFNEQPSGDPVPLATLSPDDLSAAADALLGGAQPVAYVKPAGFPRIPPVTQFDGGPFQGSNCTLASGAMLARLGYGIVTTGSILRTLQDDQDGGTGINDLATALWRGYGITFPHGLIKTGTLKSLLTSGYGAVIQGDYSKIPPGLRLQRDFTGGHAIYLDGYYPGNAKRGIPEAYYVIDPIGRPKYGYQGDWWPASVVDDFALAWGGGRVVAMWGYPPGGVPPDVVGPDVLPIPPDTGGTSPSATPTPAPSGSAEPSASPSATPSPSGPVGPVISPVDAGDLTVQLSPEAPPVGHGGLGGLVLTPIIDVCLFDPRPAGCPVGIEAVFDLGPPPVLQLPAGPTVDVVFVDSDRPDVAIVGFTVDPPTTADVKFWQSGVSPASVHTSSSMTSATLFGQTILLARLDVHAATTYQFQAVAGSGLSAGSSPIGSFTTGDGVAQFDVALSSIASPRIALGTGLSPYVHLAPGAYAQPMIPMGSLGGGACFEQAGFGGTQFCLDLGDAPPPVTCTQAQVTYTLAGIDATGVVVRAFPGETGEGDGGVTLDGVLEADGPAPSGTVGVGCLTPGMTYQVVLDAVGDDRGVLAARTVTVP
jgi:hypothetical protein